MNSQMIASKFNLHPIIGELLEQRGMNKYSDIEDFFNPSLDKLQSYQDIPNINQVIKTIKNNIASGSIVIFCDYDCDGLVSASILYKAIKKYDAQAKVEIISSDRYRDEYSLSKAAVGIIKKKKPSLVITVDCGISSSEEIKQLKDSEIEVIVLDHHENDDNESIQVLENNYLDLKVKKGKYRFTELSAGGLTWRLAQALLEESFLEVLDLVALSTVADVVPLLGENRFIVAAGLAQMQNGEINSGLKALFTAMNVTLNSLDTSDLGYKIGPALNAAGRLGSPEPALDLLLYSERNPHSRINQIADKLVLINEERKKLTERVMNIVDKKINNELNVIVIKGPIQPGLVGLIAGKLAHKYKKPVIVLDKDSLKGSARSIEPFNMYENLKLCQKEGLLAAAGGHEMAAGLRLKPGKFQEFFVRINKLAEKVELIGDTYDLSLDLQEVDGKFINDIYKLAPFGSGNRHPIFLSEEVNIEEPCLIKNKHIKFQANGKESIAFFMADKFEEVKSGKVDIIYQPKWSKFRGQIKINLIVKDIRS
ncbi:MAG: single-stranded-DNA-specific exonuclease RecJ [Bacillota bacterium]